MKKIVALSLFVVFALILSDEASAQKFTRRKRYYSVGWSIGACNYVGDLDPGQSPISPSLAKTGIHAGLFSGMFRWKPRISFRGSLSYNMIRGNDWESQSTTGDAAFRKMRNLSFINHMAELKVDAVYDLFPNKGTYLKRPEYTPYAFLGLAIFYQTPLSDDNKNLRAMQNEGVSVSPVQIAVPFGLGVRKKLNKEWDFAFEIGWRMTFTDFLDDVSGNYAGIDNGYANRSLEPKVVQFAMDTYGFSQADAVSYLGESGFGGKGTKRGTSKYDDWYIVTNIMITKVMKGGVRCPKFR